MKNIDIHPRQVVPIEPRLKIYKEALDLIKDNRDFRTSTGDWVFNDVGLCLILPCLLWDLHYMYNPPNGNWHNWDTPIMFPELNKFILVHKVLDITTKEKQELRIKFLEEAIEELELKQKVESKKLKNSILLNFGRIHQYLTFRLKKIFFFSR